MGLCISIFMALRAKLSFEGDIIFEISLREIRKKMSPSKDNGVVYKYFYGASRQIIF